MSKKSVIDGILKELSNFNIFESLSLSAIKDLCEGCEVIVNDHRESIYSEGDIAHSFGIILSGAYKLTRLSPLGEEVILHFCVPGDAIAVFIMAQEKPVYPISVVAMGPSRFLKIPRNTYLKRWKEKPDVIFKVQSLLSTRFGSIHAQKVLAKAPLKTKIAFLLIDILNKSEQNSTILPLPLTRKEIADSLGVTTESVIRVMSEWSKTGFIETIDTNIKILRMDELIKEMSYSPT